MATEHNLRVANGAGAPAVPQTDHSSAKTRSNKPTKILPTARIAFGKQMDILRAYAAASGPNNKLVTLREVSEIVKMASGTVTLSNPFFVDIRLIARTEGMGLTPSSAVMEFGRAYEWNRETAAHKLAPHMAKTWFAEALLPKLAFGEIPEKEAISTLADKSSSPPQYKNQLRLLLDYLEVSGLIKRENGHIKAARAVAVADATPEPEHHEAPLEDRPMKASVTSSRVSTSFAQPTQGNVNFHIDFKMDMAEFAGWQADRIAAFFNGIAQVLSAKAAIEKDASSSE